MVRPVRGALSQARTARAGRRNEQGKGARAPFDGRRCCSTRFGPRSYFSFDACTPGPSLGAGKFSFHPTGGSVPRIQRTRSNVLTIHGFFFSPPTNLPLPIPFSPRLLNKLNVSPQDTQTSVRVLCVGQRIIQKSHLDMY